MRTERGRTKKLTVAFWFYLRGEPAWKCDECRAAGLAGSRRCGFLGLNAEPSAAPVWAAGGLVLTECPKPLATARSLAMIAAYVWWVRAGRMHSLQLPAKWADAFRMLDELSAQATRQHEEAGARNQVPSNLKQQAGDS